ncbi:hypothetical protein Barb6_02535 [Bacteroidales bacterium Barb6]|nr:hypothetical protein Barb6_02535 [Bacteroidales bacterium Barb6]
MRRGVRDEHGRFPGRESLSARAGFLHRPVVDEYGRLLHRWLRQAGVPLPEEKQGIRKIYLTHDVDAPFLYRSWKGFVRSLLDKRGIAASLKGKFGALESDPYYTFPDIFRQENPQRGIECRRKTFNHHFHQLRERGDNGNEYDKRQETQVYFGIFGTHPGECAFLQYIILQQVVDRQRADEDERHGNA